MFRSFKRRFFPNPFDAMLDRLEKKKGKRIVIAWNRGLGDIALGLYAMVLRIHEKIENPEIFFVTRPNLQQGFSLLEKVTTIIDFDWKRGDKICLQKSLKKLGMDPKEFDLVIENPSPTDWVYWQRGKVVPKLRWDPSWEDLWKKFGLSSKEGKTRYIAIQVEAETNYGLWRNLPLEKWGELLDRLERLEDVKVVLFGFEKKVEFPHKNLIDLRGKTSLYELLSIIKNCCHHLILPDSGILSMAYYLDVSFDLHIISLWADPNHGILKQNVASPNRLLRHTPFIGKNRDLSFLSMAQVMDALFMPKALQHCPFVDKIEQKGFSSVGLILLAAGEASRLGRGPKGLVEIAGKPLFSWIIKTLPKEVPIAIMTSLNNHEAIVAFFEKHAFFERKIFFFSQSERHFLDEKGKVMKEKGPDGNGALFSSFQNSLAWSYFQEQKIDVISVIAVDNPLAKPLDSSFLALFEEDQVDVALQCIEEKEANSSMGVLIQRERGGIEIAEYMELDPSIEPCYRYTGTIAFRFSFFQECAQRNLPLHRIWKHRGTKSFWKEEKFLFDVLPFAKKVQALCYPKEKIFAPLKRGEDLEGIEKILFSERFYTICNQSD